MRLGGAASLVAAEANRRKPMDSRKGKAIKALLLRIKSRLEVIVDMVNLSLFLEGWRLPDLP